MDARLFTLGDSHFRAVLGAPASCRDRWSPECPTLSPEKAEAIGYDGWYTDAATGAPTLKFFAPPAPAPAASSSGGAGLVIGALALGALVYALA